jgi:uncharacterized membrane protein YhhN
MSKNMSVVFLFFSLLYMIGLSYVVDILWLLKIVPISLLGFAVLKTKPSVIRTILLGALLCSGCGDLLLAVDEFIFGVAAFLLAQLGYAVLFSRYWQGIYNRWQLSLVLIMYMLGMAWWLIPNLGELQLPVMAYFITIAAMGLLAVQSSLPLRWAVLGAVVFIISDSFIAINKFVMPVPLESYWIMSSYYAAQFMLVYSFLKLTKQQNNV